MIDPVLELLRLHLGTAWPRLALGLGEVDARFERGLEDLAERAHVARAGRAPHAAAALVADGERLPYRSGALDLVCLVDTLASARDEDLLLDEARRVLRPGGLCLVRVPAARRRGADAAYLAGGARRYDRGSLSRRLADRGLVVERTTCTGLLRWPFALPGALRRLAERLELLLTRRIDLPVGRAIVALARRRDAADVLPARPRHRRAA